MRLFGYDIFSGCFINALKHFLFHPNCSLYMIRCKSMHYIHFYVVYHASFTTYSYEFYRDRLLFGNPFLEFKHLDNKLIWRNR